jgi:hypothetical protein
MSQRQLAYASMRIGAVAILLSLLGGLPAVWETVVHVLGQSGSAGGFVALLFTAASFFLALLMWLFPVSLAKRFGIWNLEAGDDDEQTAHWLADALLSVVGIYLTAVALADLAYVAGQHIAIRMLVEEPVPLPGEVLGGYLASLTQIVLGLALALGGGQIAERLRRFRPLSEREGGGA